MKYLIIYLEIEHMLNFLSQNEKGDFLDLMIAYAKKQEDPVIENKNVLNVFNFIRGRLDAQFEKARVKAEVARKNGVGGGRPADKKKPKKTNPKPKITQSVVEDQFESFWNLYDKKKSRPDAERKFKAALKKDTFENIIAGLEKYIEARRSDPQYWKNPSTWLHQECWKDEHTQSNQQQAQAITHFATKLNQELGLNLFYSSTYTQNILTLKCFNKEALNQAFNLDEALKVKIRELCQSEYQSQPNIIC